MSMMGGMILQNLILDDTSVKTMQNINFQFSVHIDGGNEDWGYVSVILKYQILLCQVNFIKYGYDKCQRKNRSDSFHGTG